MRSNCLCIWFHSHQNILEFQKVSAKNVQEATIHIFTASQWLFSKNYWLTHYSLLTIYELPTIHWSGEGPRIVFQDGSNTAEVLQKIDYKRTETCELLNLLCIWIHIFSQYFSCSTAESACCHVSLSHVISFAPYSPPSLSFILIRHVDHIFPQKRTPVEKNQLNQEENIFFLPAWALIKLHQQIHHRDEPVGCFVYTAK